MKNDVGVLEQIQNTLDKDEDFIFMSKVGTHLRGKASDLLDILALSTLVTTSRIGIPLQDYLDPVIRLELKDYQLVKKTEHTYCDGYEAQLISLVKSGTDIQEALDIVRVSNGR